jgi:hypothetical protein
MGGPKLTVEEHLARWAVPKGVCPEGRISDATLAFIVDIRRAAKEGVGYGAMQQIIEWEWAYRLQEDQQLSSGAFGPAHFWELLDEKDREIAQLKRRLRERG